MTSPIRGIDHAIVAVRDLDAARATYERLGFRAAPLGNHVGKATANHCIMFADSYIELLGVNEPEQPDTLSLGGFLAARGEGLVKIALATPDADAARAALEERGFHPTGPDDLARPLEEAAGAMVRFRNLQIPPAETGDLGTFLCGHRTPELMRPAGATEHANGARNLVAAAAIVEDIAAVAEPWARLVGAPAPTEAKPGEGAVDLGRGRLQLVTPEGFLACRQVLPMTLRPDPLPARPFYYGLRIEVASLLDTFGMLRAAGVEPTVMNSGPPPGATSLVHVAPADACGVPLEFVEARGA